jgi:hypothetical protein
MRNITIVLLAVLLAACSQKKEARITTEDAVADVQNTRRSEPIFYNGKTYRFELDPTSAGQFALKVSPMTAAQEKDAVAVATSSLGYFACPEGKKGKLTGKPRFAGSAWTMQAVCG